ncbi:MAG: TonB-dependent hemoglobin/transferrin/lactoferrin family receptor [Verrucomicrobiota bacterium JB023]|nr:TonB-dependent hemoglobin/transferrin/lactoferrin family receptor [Verrucomicrobiota bacterium JB023]
MATHSKFPVLVGALCASVYPRASAQTLLIDETVVVASRVEEEAGSTAGTSSAITSEELLQHGVTNLTEAFKYEPGVSVPFDFSGTDGLVPYLSGGDQGINIRGLEGNRISINVDGIRQPEDFVANSFEGAGGPGRIYFDPATFAQLELYKSAASSLYGSDALAGAVEGRTESALTLLGAELDGRLHRNTFTFSSVNESIHNRSAYAVGNGTLAASVVHSFRRGQERINNSSFPANPVDFESNALVATLTWRPSDEWEFTGTGDFYYADSFTDIDSAEGDTGQTIINNLLTSDDVRRRLRFSLDATHRPLHHPLYDSLTATAYWQQAKASTENVQQGLAFGFTRNWLNEIDYQTEIAGLQLQANKELGAHRLGYGLDASSSEISSSFFRTQSFASGAALVEDRIAMAPSDVYRAGAYLRDEIHLGNDERWKITPAVRIDQYAVRPDNTTAFLDRTDTGDGESIEASDYDNFSLSPSLSILYNLTDNLNVYGSWAQGTRNPSAEELSGVFSHGSDFITVPNPELTEERSNSFELGLQYSSESFSAQLSTYYNLYDDFLENNVLSYDNPNPGEPDELTTVNRGEVEIYGLEVKADWLLGESISSLQGLSLGGSFSWNEGHADDGSGSGEEPLNSIEPWKAVAYLGYDHGDEQWGGRLSATYSAAKDATDIAADEDTSLLPSDSWFTLDLTAYYALSDSIRLRAGVSNLLDEEYILWSTARRGTGHGGANLPTSFYSQPGRAFFISCDLEF